MTAQIFQSILISLTDIKRLKVSQLCPQWRVSLAGILISKGSEEVNGPMCLTKTSELLLTIQKCKATFNVTACYYYFLLILNQLWMYVNLQRPGDRNNSLMLRFCHPSAAAGCGHWSLVLKCPFHSVPTTDWGSVECRRSSHGPLRTHRRGGLRQRWAPTVLLCDVPSQDAPLVPLQEMKESWHGVDVTLSRISP